MGADMLQSVNLKVRRSGGRAVSTTIACIMLAAFPPDRLTAQCPNGAPPPCSRGRRPHHPAASRSSTSPTARRIRPTPISATALTEGIITRLSRDLRLQVKSTAAVERLRGRTPPPDSAGRVLRVTHLVSGSVARLGPPAARVGGAGAGQQRRDDVGGAIRPGRRGSLRPPGRDRGHRRDGDRRAAPAGTPATDGRARPPAPEAYDRFLQGNYRLARRTPDDVRIAIRHYEEATALDPGFAAAHARIALAYGVALDWGWPSSTSRRRSGPAWRPRPAPSSWIRCWPMRGRRAASSCASPTHAPTPACVRPSRAPCGSRRAMRGASPVRVCDGEHGRRR